MGLELIPDSTVQRVEDTLDGVTTHLKMRILLSIHPSILPSSHPMHNLLQFTSIHLSIHSFICPSIHPFIHTIHKLNCLFHFKPVTIYFTCFLYDSLINLTKPNSTHQFCGGRGAALNIFLPHSGSIYKNPDTHITQTNNTHIPSIEVLVLAHVGYMCFPDYWSHQ